MRRAARVAVLGVMASGLLSLTGIVRAASPAVSPTLSPPPGEEAVRSGSILGVGGIADPGWALLDAQIRFFDSAGEPARDPLDATGHIGLDGGAFFGQYPLPSLCQEPSTVEDCRRRLNDGTVVLAVMVERDGETAVGTSNGVPIDMVDPYILRTSLVAPDRVQVLFSEPVRLPQGTADSALDWTVYGHCQKGRPAIAIEGEGAVRNLTLLLAEDEDATPLVTYCPLPNRPTYKDRANRDLGGTGRITVALDRIAPKIPAITEIAGRAGTNIVANDPSPMVRVSGLRAGHFGQVYLESGGDEPGFQRSQDTLLGEAQAGPSGTAEVQVLQDLSPDGTYNLYGVARDRATCTSGGSEECPNYSGGDPATYTLDTVVPLPLFAATDGPEVLVRFTEEVSGTDSPTQWTVDGVPPMGVSGSGEERILSVSPDARAGAPVNWEPPATGAYADAAGNQVARFSLPALDHIPPVITVADPIAAVWTSANRYEIVGSVSKPGSTVQSFNGENEAGRDELGPSETDFALDVALAADQTNNFVLRATDSLGNVTRQDTFLPPIIQDSTAPTVKVLAPTQSDVLAGGTAFTIKWEAADANFDSGPISISFAPGGGDWETVSAAEANDGEYNWTPPMISMEQAQIRMAATDRVGFAAEAVSELFSIDADAPTFGAVTIADSTQTCASERLCVVVQFTELVKGHVSADEWKIAGLPAGDAKATSLVVGTKRTKIILETLPTHDLGKNELPEISYEPGTVPGREELHDEAGNRVPDGAKTVQAEDGVPPVAPVIEQIAGQSADQTVTYDDPTPEIKVGNIDRGDTALIFVESDGTDGWTGGDRLVGSARAGVAGATNGGAAGPAEAVVITEPLGDPGEYTLYAAALDPGGNQSEGADDATYRLEGVIFLPTPVIEQIAGEPAAEPVKANDPSPDVKVGNVAEGNTAAVFAESDGQAGLTADDRKLGEQTAGPDGALVQTADLGADATYTLYATARDAEGRRSGAADQATYILDTANPAFTAAVTDERHVLVTFGEAVAGLAAEAEWQIDGAPSNTTEPAGMRSGLTTLTLEALPNQTIAPTATPQISYGPVGGSADPARTELRDEAGNTIEVKTVQAAAKGMQPVPVPVPKPAPKPGQQPPSQGGPPVPGTGGSPCDILGTAGNDILLGTDGDDVICGSAGNDVIRGGAGEDLIVGQEGNDVLRGGAGSDELSGGADKDSLLGEAGADILRGDAGVDRLSGGPGNDYLDGGPSKDRCTDGSSANRTRRC